MQAHQCIVNFLTKQMISNEDYLSPLLRKVVMIPLLVQIPICDTTLLFHSAKCFQPSERDHLRLHLTVISILINRFFKCMSHLHSRSRSALKTLREDIEHILYLLEDPNPIEEVKSNKFLMMHQSKGLTRETHVDNIFLA